MMASRGVSWACVCATLVVAMAVTVYAAETEESVVGGGVANSVEADVAAAVAAAEAVSAAATEGQEQLRNQHAHGHGLHHRRTKQRSSSPPLAGPKSVGVVQFSKSARRFFFTPSALTYTGHEDTIVAAWGTFADNLHTTGWGELSITTSGKVPDMVQSYAAGYAEGALTAQRIYELFTVIHDVHAKKPEVGEFIRAQDRFIRSKIRQFSDRRRKLKAARKLAATHGPRAGSPVADDTADADAEHDSEFDVFLEADVNGADTDATAAAATDSAAADADATAAPTKRPLHDIHIGASGSAHSDSATLSFSAKFDAAARKAAGAPASAPANPAVSSSGEWSEFEMVYWFNVKLIMAQFDGLLNGYNAHRNPKTTKALRVEDLWLVNNDGDILDIERAVSPGRVFSNPAAPAKQELLELLSYNSRCSVMVKWTGEDLLCGHATWDDYNEMNRMYKYYHFKFSDPLHASALQSQRTSMSSYPGMIFSSDDFYVLDSGLVLLETTLNILNEKLYALSDPRSTVMAWIRNIVANRLASNGDEWAALFAHYNSGTYNNQWMIVDYKRFNPRASKLAPGTLTLFEQIPGFTKAEDVTAILQKEKYWASYNRPFFAETNARSMFEHFANAEGASQREKELFTYSQCPRAILFAREADDVNDLEDLKEVLRLNRYPIDPISAGCPGDAIAARYDLPPTPGSACDVAALRANGATDAKVTNYAMAMRLEAQAVAGPTDDDCDEFVWSKTKFRKPPGQPDVFNFDWKVMAFADTDRGTTKAKSTAKPKKAGGATKKAKAAKVARR